MDFNSCKKVISNCNYIVRVGMVSAFALFLGASTTQASVNQNMSQKVFFKARNYTIESVIQQIEKQTDYMFVYNKNEVNLKRTVYLDGSNTDAIELSSNPQLSPSTSFLRAHVLSLLNYQIN